MISLTQNYILNHPALPIIWLTLTSRNNGQVFKGKRSNDDHLIILAKNLSKFHTLEGTPLV